MEKYGFVYIWYDRKHKRFYIGSHWGVEDDGYICSSNWMRRAYKRRPKDFRRKIISKIYTSRYDLLVEEERWLSFIKKEEIGKRYYNLIKTAKHIYHANEEKAKSVYEKISQSHKNDPNWASWSKGKIVSSETREKLRQHNLGKKLSDETRAKIKAKWENEEYRRINTENKIGKTQSKEQIEKRINTIRSKGNGFGPPKGTQPPNKGTKRPGTFWFNNGFISTRAFECPNGYVKGRLK